MIKADPSQSEARSSEMVRRRAQVRQCGDCLIGYRRRDETWTAAAPTLVNPPNKGEPLRWEAGDMLILICQN